MTAATLGALRTLALGAILRRAGKAADPDAEWAAAVALREAHAGAIAAAVAGVAKRVREDAEAGLARLADEMGAVKRDPPPGMARIEGIWDLALWVRLVLEEVAPEVAAAALGGFRAGLVRVGVLEAEWGRFSAESDYVQRAVARSVEFIRGAGVTTQESLARAVLAGVENGEDAAGITARVSAVLRSVEDVEEGRAGTIGRTSATTAYEAGQVDAFRQAGVTRKPWLSSPG